MNKRELVKKLGRNLLFTLLISCVLTFLLIEIIYRNQTNSLEGNQGVFIMVIAAIVWCFVLSLCSATAFLNIYYNFNKSKINEGMAFFLLPCLVIVFTLFKSNAYQDWKAFIIMTLPFIVTHIYFFVSFLKFKKTYTIINHNL